MATDDGMDDLYEKVPMSPTAVAVHWPSLPARAQEVIDRAWELLTPQRALATNLEITDLPSFTGEEAPLAHHLAERLSRSPELQAWTQPLDPRSANAQARLAGGSGPQLALVAPIDTHFSGRAEIDGGQWGDPPRRDGVLPAQVVGQTVLGLGSDNPKSMVTAIVLALEALAEAGFQPRGELSALFAAAGAPARAPQGEPRAAISLGAGVAHAVSHGFVPDYVLYHKPGYRASWEDASLNQFEITISGDPTYMALGGYQVMEAVLEIAREVNLWGRRYGARSHGSFDAFAALNVVQIGRPERPNWSSGVAKAYADVRTAPLAPLSLGRRIIERVVSPVAERFPEVEVRVRQVAHMSGGATPPDAWVVQTAIRAGLAVDGIHADDYSPPWCGQTEMGHLQRLGIPCAKVDGWPAGHDPSPELPADLRGFSLSGSYAPNIVKAAKALVYAAVDTLSRSEDELRSWDERVLLPAAALS